MSFVPSNKQRRRKAVVSMGLAGLALVASAVAMRYPAQAPVAQAASTTIIGQICASQAARDGWATTVDNHPQCAPYAVRNDTQE